MNLLETEKEKVIDAKLQDAREKRIITNEQFAELSDKELLAIIEKYNNAFENLKSALNDALGDGHIEQPFIDRVIEKPGSAEEMIKLTGELNMLTHGKGYERQQNMLTQGGGYEKQQEGHVNQKLTYSGCEKDIEKISADLCILKLLLESDQSPTQEEIISKIGKSRTAIWKALNRLETKGLIESNKRSRFKYYNITEKGKSHYYDQYVNPSHRGMRNKIPMVRIHNKRLKGSIIGNSPINHMSEWKVFFPNNWKGYIRRFHNDELCTVTVKLTSKNAILYFSIVSANSLDEAETKMGNAVGWIIEKLAREGIYVTDLHQDSEPSYALVYDPIAEEYFKHKITYDGSAFSIDHSHNTPEIEYHSKDKFERYQKFIECIGDGRIDPERLINNTD